MQQLRPVRTSRQRSQTKAHIAASGLCRTLFEESPIPMWAYDRETLRFLIVNNAAVQHYGYSVEEFLGMTIADIRPATDLPRLRRFFKRREYSKKTWGAWRHRKKDGTIIDVEVFGVQHTISGRPASIAVINDVTNQHRMELERQADSDRLRLVVSQLPAFVWTTDKTPVYTSYQGSAKPLFDRSISDMVGRSVLMVATDEMPADLIMRNYRTALAGRTVRYEYSKRGRLFECQLQPLRAATGAVTGTVGVAVEVTERRRTVEELVRQEALFAAGQQIAHLGSWQFDANTGRVTWSDELYEILGHARTDTSLDKASFMAHVHPDDADALEQAFNGAVETRKAYRLEHRILRGDGTVRWLLCLGQPMYNADGSFTNMLGSALDITERKIAEDRVNHLALHDSLTGLPNRLNAEDFIDAAIADATQAQRGVALLMLDIDRFKTINDALGHAVGDELLIAITQRLRTSIRPEDAMARLGGDTFIVALTAVERMSDVSDVANRILRQIADPFVLASSKLSVTGSIGISVSPTHGVNASELIEGAEAAMFRAKELGRNRIQFSAPNQKEEALEQFTLEQDLRAAIERDEFVLWYQPIVDFKSGAIVAAEALVRWQHPRRGLVPPASFIPLAEETGLIVPIGDYVLNAAARQVASWRGQGFKDFRVALNVSPTQIRHPSIVDSVRSALELTGIDPSALNLEVTESGIMTNANAVLTLETLGDMGVGLSLDDFGTGYSSLAHLRRLPIDTLKIDRTFISDVATDAADAAIANTIVTLGHSLNMEVIAEGVETRDQWDFVRDLGCDAMQGYYYSRPMNAEDFTALLASDRRITVQEPA